MTPFQRAPLRRPEQRSVAACLDIAMSFAGIPDDMQARLIAHMSDQIASASGGSGGFDNYFSLRSLRQDAQTNKESSK